MTDPAAFAAQQQQQQQQQQQLTAADYNARTLMYMQQQQQQQQYQQQLALQQAAAAGGAAAAAAAARPQAAKPVSRAPSRPAPSRQPNRRREYDSDDDDDDEFEDYAHLLSQAEREKRKKRLVGSGDRDSDDDFMTPPESSSSSSEEESSTDEEEEDDGEGEVTTSEEEDFGYGPPKKDRELQMRRRRGSDSESDGERRRSKAKSDGREQFLKAVDPVLRRQLLRFFEAVAKQNANKKAAGSNTWPALPAISLSLAEWDKPEQQRMAFCELLNLCPVEAKADKPEPYHYPRQTCATGINYYCTFQPDRPQPAKGQPAPNQEWVKRFEDRVKQWFALEPIGQYMLTIPAVTNEEKAADAAYVAAIAQANNPPAAAAAAGKQKKNKRDEAGSDDDGAGKKRGGNADGARKKQKTKKGDASDEEGDHKSGAAAAAAAGIAAAPKGMAPPQPALPQAWRTLFLQQLDVSIRRQILQLYAATNPDRLIQGHRENFSAKFGKDLIGINFERACELSGVTPKMYDAKAAQLHVLNYFNFRPQTPVNSLVLPTPSFVYAFQTQVREWLRSAPVQALLASEYYVQPDANAQADDAEFLKAQAEARALPPVEYAYSVPGLPAVAPVVKSGPA